MRVVEPKIEIENFDGIQIMKNIERACRTCYRSEGKVTEDSFKKLLTNCINRGHESILEHEKVSVRILGDISFYKDITRHRHASFSIESTRYCVAEGMRIDFLNPHMHYTIDELYNAAMNSKNGSWKRMKIKNVNENTGKIQYCKFKNIMFNGEKECLRIKTDLGYEIIVTPEHLIYTPNGYVEAKELNVGEKMYVNGVTVKADKLYHNQSLKIIYADTIVSIENVGKRKVYDIEMDSEFHNFVANGVVVHNCCYDKDKFGNEITFINPPYFRTENTGTTDLLKKRELWKECMEYIEKTYMKMRDMGCPPDECRMILPHSTAAEIAMTANIREWKHIFELRCSNRAHPSVQQIMIPLLLYFKKQMPEIFDNVPYNEKFPKEKYAKLTIMKGDSEE